MTRKCAECPVCENEAGAFVRFSVHQSWCPPSHAISETLGPEFTGHQTEVFRALSSLPDSDITFVP